MQNILCTNQTNKKRDIYRTSRASRLGFHNDDPEWANMGQGAPETGEYVSYC